jgi:protoporphyrin/coproporphyrin ferrochelatase
VPHAHRDTSVTNTIATRGRLRGVSDRISADVSERAILLVNLGSPDSTSIRDVRKYLDEFLMDEHVLDYPHWVRALLVRGVILNVRPKKSAAAYREIWWDEGSPLVVLSKRLQTALQARVAEPVALAMRYQNPSIEASLRELAAKHPHLKELLLVPLYPHYAMATTETVAKATREAMARLNLNWDLKILPPFFDHPAYINAMVTVTKPHLEAGVDRVLFSYHGIPKRHVRKSDCTGSHCLTATDAQGNDCCHIASPAHAFCYRHQAVRTTELMTEALGIGKDRYQITFQSRLGGGWLTPFTDITLKELPKQGVKRIAILCPAFVSDCLETLEEIAGEGKEIFMEAGGESFTYIPCMNDHPTWVAALETIIGECWSAKPFTETNSLRRGAVAAV